MFRHKQSRGLFSYNQPIFLCFTSFRIKLSELFFSILILHPKVSFVSEPIQQNKVVNSGFVEVKPSAEQDIGAILQVSLPNGVRIGISCPKTNSLVEQVLTFVGQLS